jgi:hypothetical protein
VKELQREREQKEKDELAQAAKLYIAAKTDHKSFDPAEHGFEFVRQESLADLMTCKEVIV